MLDVFSRSWELTKISFRVLLNNIFNTALFVYADRGELPSGFDQDTLEGAFRHRRARGY
jgi:hypothetical protein